jgi:acetolactate synthase regulatory subunit
MNNKPHCRKSQAEIDRDVAHRLDQEQGLSDTPEQIVKDRVFEIMMDMNANNDAKVVLMESERFCKALWKQFAHRYDTQHVEMKEAAVNTVSVAETVLSEWMEKSL